MFNIKKLETLTAIVIFAIALTVPFEAAAEKGKSGADESASASSSVNKFGYVDLNRALNTVEEGRRAKAQLEADGTSKKQKLDILQNELKNMKDDLDKQRLILSADAMREKEMQFQQKFLELQKRSLEFEKDFAEKEVNFIKPISEKLKKVITDIGQAEGYTMIIPKEMALYSPPGTDLTDRIIAAYNNIK